MKYIKRVNNLREVILKKKIKIIPIDIKHILIDSLAYDGEYNITQIKLIKERERYIQCKYIKNELNALNLNIGSIFDHMKTKYEHISSSNILALLLIQEMFYNWEDIFGKGSKKIKDPTEKNIIYTHEGILKVICKISFGLFAQKPLGVYNFTKGILVGNYFLNIIGFPGIIFSYKDRKRVLKSLEHYIDFEKEFYLTLEGRCYKLLYEKTSSEAIISLEALKKKRNTSHIYVSPGSWWYGEDRKKYTFIKK